MLNTSPATDSDRGDLLPDVAEGERQALRWLIEKRGGRRRGTMATRREGLGVEPSTVT
jgi:hypothetical protein